jgi:hypothetical protein
VGRSVKNRKIDAALDNFHELVKAGGPRQFFQTVASMDTKEERIKCTHVVELASNESRAQKVDGQRQEDRVFSHPANRARSSRSMAPHPLHRSRWWWLTLL